MGPGFAFVGESARELQPGAQLSPCYPRRCALGTSVDFANLTRTFGFQAHDGSITLEDQTFDVSWLSAQFTVRGAPMLLPDTVDGTATVSTPVEVSAALTAWISDGLLNPPQAIQLNLNGSGTARMLLRRPPAAPGELFPEDWLDEVTLQFGSPAPVPEPATMTLLGLGLGLVVLKGRRRLANREPKPPSVSTLH
jgi:hypothetical protein